MLNKILTLIVLLLPSLAYAEEGKFTYLEPGMQAPFKGTLFDDSATAHILTLPEYYSLQCDLDLEYEISLINEKHLFVVKDLQSEIDFLKSEKQSIIIQTDERIALLEEQVKKNTRNDRPWYLAAGVAIGIGITVGVVKGLETSQ